MFQEPFLPPQATTVAAESAVGANDAMTRNDDREHDRGRIDEDQLLGAADRAHRIHDAAVAPDGQQARACGMSNAQRRFQRGAVARHIAMAPK